jgi:hypothetical protein
VRDRRQRGVDGDGALVGEVHEVGRPLDHDVVDLAARLGDADPLDPLGEVARRLLLEEAAGADAVGEPLQRHRATAGVGHHQRRDPAVVLDQVELGDAVTGEQHLGGVPDRDRVPPEAQLDAPAGGGPAHRPPPGSDQPPRGHRSSSWPHIVDRVGPGGRTYSWSAGPAAISPVRHDRDTLRMYAR